MSMHHTKILKINQLQPLKIGKSQASYQALLLDMMGKFYNQQKIFVEEQKTTNKLLRRLVGQEASESVSQSKSISPQKNLMEEKANSPFSFKNTEKLTSSKKVLSKLHSQSEDNQVKSIVSYNQNFQVKSIDQSKIENYPIKKQQEKNNYELKKITEILLRVENSLEKKQQNLERILKLNLDLTKQIPEKKIKFRNQEEKIQSLMKIESASQNKQIENYLSLAFKQKMQSQNDEGNKNLGGKKKNYNILSELQPYSDRRELKIKIPIEEIMESTETIDLKASIQEWLGVVYRATASICWHMLSNHLLNFEEVKILFTENIVYNFIECMQTIKEKGFGDQRAQMAHVVNKTSIKILSYLCKQYPLTKIDTPNMALRDKIQPINDKGNAEFDLIGQLSAHDENISFALRQDRNYTSLIMRCINHMIIRTKKQYTNFEKSMAAQFQEIFYKNKREKKQQEDQNKKFSTIEEEKYYEQVKSYTKILIGCKINKNTELYSEHEIENGVFYVKSMSVLRIITKWLEAVQQMYENPKKEIKETTNQFKDNKGNYLYLYQQVKTELYKKVKENRKFLQEKLDSIKKQCYKMEVLLSQKQFTTDSDHYHLSVEQTSVGRYCTNLKSAISSYICSELSEVIHFLLEIPTKINLQKLGLDDKRDQRQVKEDIKRLNLIQLKLFDLLRCKCISKQSEIIYLLDRIYEKHNDINDQFRIVRIKDRLNQTTRDILLNVQLKKKGLVCQIQLAVVGNIDKKQQLLDSYSHFLYELQRAQLGPLSENACIWGALDQKAIFFQNLKKQENKKTKARKPHACVQKYEMEEHTNLSNYFQNFFRPLICESCSSFFEIPRTCLQNVVCKLCNKTFCGECQLSALSSVSTIMRKKFIFESNKMNHFLKYLTEYTDFDKPFPKKGFIIRKNYLNKELIFYNIVEKEIDQNQKDNESGDELEKRYRLEMTNTVIQKKKIISKILNKQPIIAVERDRQLFIEPAVNQKNIRKERQLETFFIYTFDETTSDKIKLSRGSWGQILQKCQNVMKVINLIHAPNYVSDLKFMKMSLKEIQKINTDNDNRLAEQQISYIISGGRLTLIEIATDQDRMRAGLQKKKNLAKIVDMVKKKNVFVDMEFSGLTDQLNQERLLPEVRKQHLLKQFYSQIQKLNLNFCKVSDIKFVQPMISLSIIYLKKNLLISLEGVEGLENLTAIRFQDNNVISLEPLQKLTKLTYIGAAKNQITSMKGIQNLINLQTLSIPDNSIAKIEYLDKINLRSLEVAGNNQLQSLQNIHHMKQIRKLTCGRTKITEINEFQKFDQEGLESMESISVQYLDLKVIPISINKFINLLELDLQKCNLKQIDNLSNLKKLKEIDLMKNFITSMTPLEHNIALQFVKLDDNLVEDISGIGPLVMLRKLSLRKNPLKKFTDLNKLEFDLSINYTLSSEEEAKKCTVQFQKSFNDWKEFKGTSSASSSSEENN